jgi:hypothetical protein
MNSSLKAAGRLIPVEACSTILSILGKAFHLDVSFSGDVLAGFIAQVVQGQCMA